MLDESATCLGGFYVTSRASLSASTPASDSHPIHSFCSCSQCKIRPRLCFGSIISSRHAIFGLCLPVFCSRHRSPVLVTVPPDPVAIPNPSSLSRTRHRYPEPVTVLPFPSPFSRARHRSPVPVIVLPFSWPSSRSRHCRYSPFPVVVIIPIIVSFTSIFVILRPPSPSPEFIGYLFLIVSLCQLSVLLVSWISLP